MKLKSHTDTIWNINELHVTESGHIILESPEWVDFRTVFIEIEQNHPGLEINNLYFENFFDTHSKKTLENKTDDILLYIGSLQMDESQRSLKSVDFWGNYSNFKLSRKSMCFFKAIFQNFLLLVFKVQSLES